LRLSRVFEVGAYVAVAAAIVVGVFLGVQLLQHRTEIASLQSTVQSPVAPAGTSSVIQQPQPAARAESVKPAVNAGHETPMTVAMERPHVARNSRLSSPSVTPDTTEETSSTADAGYVALMFCDPLSCATDSQVVRMELPAQNNTQPQMADVVVGFDGVVRAVRIVN
jgi:hypothetical protein